MGRVHSIKASEMFEPVDIELWDGSKFRLREATRSVEDKVETQQKKINDLAEQEGSTMNDALPLLIEMLDILLEPKTEAKGEDGEPILVPSKVKKDGRPTADSEEVPKMVTAADSINKALEEDKIGISHIDALSKKLNETAMEARPT